MYTPAEGYRRRRAEATLQRSVMASTITRTLCVAAMVLLVLLTGTASGAERQDRPGIPNARGIYTGCYSASTGDLRLIAGSQGCRPAERRVTWNRRGQRGPLGREGEPGARWTFGAAGSHGQPGFERLSGAGRRSRPAGVGGSSKASPDLRARRARTARRGQPVQPVLKAQSAPTVPSVRRARSGLRAHQARTARQAPWGLQARQARPVQPARPVQRGRRGRRDLSWSRERLSPRLPTLLGTRS